MKSGREAEGAADQIGEGAALAIGARSELVELGGRDLHREALRARLPRLRGPAGALASAADPGLAGHRSDQPQFALEHVGVGAAVVVPLVGVDIPHVDRHVGVRERRLAGLSEAGHARRGQALGDLLEVGRGVLSADLRCGLGGGLAAVHDLIMGPRYQRVKRKSGPRNHRGFGLRAGTVPRSKE